jgi:hypothetical protein
MTRRTPGPLLLGVLLLTAVACRGGQGNQSTGAPAPVSVEVPTQILGLSVTQEDVSGQVVPYKNRSYLDTFGLFSLREGDLLRATLQMGRFGQVADEDDDTFRRQIIGLMGTSSPREILVGEEIVWSSTGAQQSVFAWFKGRGFYVLTVHKEFPFELTLLRKLMSLEQEF